MKNFLKGITVLRFFSSYSHAHFGFGFRNKISRETFAVPGQESDDPKGGEAFGSFQTQAQKGYQSCLQYGIDEKRECQGNQRPKQDIHID